MELEAPKFEAITIQINDVEYKTTNITIRQREPIMEILTEPDYNENLNRFLSGEGQALQKLLWHPNARKIVSHIIVKTGEKYNTTNVATIYEALGDADMEDLDKVLLDFFVKSVKSLISNAASFVQIITQETKDLKPVE